MSRDDHTRIVTGQILPPETREVVMPAGTPLGLGILGSARFSAIRRVLEHAQRATLAKANLLDAQGAVAGAYVRREIAREQLANLDTIRNHEADRIRIAYEAQLENEQLEKLRRRLERLALEDQIAEREAIRNRAAARDQNVQANAGVVRNEFADFIDELKRMPEVLKVAQSVKEQMIREAGGQDKLGESGLQGLEIVDVLVNSFMQKRAEGKIQ